MKFLRQVYQFVFHYIFYFGFTLFFCGPILVLNAALHLHRVNAFIQNIWGWGFFVIGGQPFSIEGEEFLEPGKAYVFAANHSSMMDIPALSALIKSPASWVLKEAMLKLPIMGWFFLMGGGIPIPRSDARTSQTRIMASVEAIRKRSNASIIIFPEGTRSPTGVPAEFKRGFLKIMKEYQMDLVPVTLIGLHDYMPMGTLVTDPSARPRLLVHKPIPWQELAALPEKEAAAKVRDLIASALPQ